MGLTVTFQKLDPYINVDPGTMNPFQHGEVYATNDGAETDLDMGHDERYTNAVMGKQNNYTSGRIYYSVIMKERRGDTSAARCRSSRTSPTRSRRRCCNSMAPPMWPSSKSAARSAISKACPSSRPFRQLRINLGREYTLFIHLTLVPAYIKTAGEVKTSPPSTGLGAAGLGHPTRHSHVSHRGAAVR